MRVTKNVIIDRELSTYQLKINVQLLQKSEPILVQKSHNFSKWGIFVVLVGLLSFCGANIFSYNTMLRYQDGSFKNVIHTAVVKKVFQPKVSVFWDSAT